MRHVKKAVKAYEQNIAPLNQCYIYAIIHMNLQTIDKHWCIYTRNRYNKPVGELARSLLSFKRPTPIIFANFTWGRGAKCFSQGSKPNELFKRLC